ncbi:MAG: M20/M25/M40 family metallo-hydrolase [Chloroflexota bacterium]|nr:M20/M25/M40 family metallo-hydrolase [Chloroflexota bacterium]
MAITQLTEQTAWDQVGDETLEHLRQLLRLDTRNPPGNETRAAEYLWTVLEREGISSEIVGPAPDRGSLVARIRGDGSQRPLLLMSHTDVVAVEPDKWSHDPFGAEIADGWLYGRGALDMKHMVAMELQTMLLLKRRGVPLKRDVIFMAAADEEVGGRQGAGWIVSNRPDLIDAEYALNEGGGTGKELNGRRYYTVQTAEKGTARFRLRTYGQPGHGSKPHDDNAILKLAARLVRLQTERLPVHLTQTVRAYLEGIASAQPDDMRAQLLAILDPAGADAAIDALGLDENFKRNLRAIIRNTVTPTMLAAGSQINVIPSMAEASLDGRILPGWTPETFQDELRPIFGDDMELEFLEPSKPLEADPAGPMFDTIKAVLAERDPQATVVPAMISGATDAKHVSKLGTRIYGFAPELYSGPAEGDRIHCHDERIAVDALRWGVRTLYEVVERFCR